MLSRLTKAAPLVADGRAARCAPVVRYMSAGKGIPKGGRAQVLMSATSVHRGGESKGIAEVLFKKGASIAGQRKIIVEDTFAMLISVYTPNDPKELVDHLTTSEVATQLGFPVAARLLDPDRPKARPGSETSASERSLQHRFKLSCPQQPGIVLALTELLQDFDCKMSQIDADTMVRETEIWFEIEAIVDVPKSTDPAKVEEGLRFWTRTKDERTSLIFDSLTSNVHSNV